jgi:hypothetical protein
MVKVGLLTILSAALGFLALLSGGRAELYSIEVGWAISAEEATVTIDPVFVIWTPRSFFSQTVLYGADARAIGNTIFMRDTGWHHPNAPICLQHEAVHVAQQRAFGMFTPLLYPFVNMEGEPGYSASIRAKDIGAFAESIKTMWHPTPDEPGLWHTLSFTHSPISQHDR